MLKIKDDVDLKELKKFGFDLINYDNSKVYHKRTELKEIEAIDYYIIQNYMYIKVQGTLDELILDNTLYDLIKACLVEKINEEQ